VLSVLTRDADQSRFLYDPLPADSLGAPQSGRAARTGG